MYVSFLNLPVTCCCWYIHRGRQQTCGHIISENPLAIYSRHRRRRRSFILYYRDKNNSSCSAGGIIGGEQIEATQGAKRKCFTKRCKYDILLRLFLLSKQIMAINGDNDSMARWRHKELSSRLGRSHSWLLGKVSFITFDYIVIIVMRHQSMPWWKYEQIVPVRINSLLRCMNYSSLFIIVINVLHN